ncbi:MAG: hypothetical protein ACI8PG_004060, partial [Planctomycetota bacterium]
QFEWSWAIAIGALALYLRWPISGLAWSHVDERAFLLYPLGFWSGDLNPHFFNYPTFHLYLVSGLYYLYYLIFSPDSLDYFIAYHYLVDGDALLAITDVPAAFWSTLAVLFSVRLLQENEMRRAFAHALRMAPDHPQVKSLQRKLMQVRDL